MGIDLYNLVISAKLQKGGGGGGDHDAEDGIIQKTISGAYENSRVTSIATNAFRSCSSLTAVSFENVTTIGDYAFQSCYRLATVSFPNVTSIGNSTFAYCSSLTTASFPNVTSIGNNAFASCLSLTTASFPNVTSIGNNAFASCSRLTTASFPNVTYIGNSVFMNCLTLLSLYLLGSSVPTLANTNAFHPSPISTNTVYTSGVYGSIYVPASLVDSYKAAKNWSAYSARITSYTG